MNEHLKEIRSGALRQLGAMLVLTVLATFLPWVAKSNGLAEYPRTLKSIRYLLVAAVVFWLGRLSVSFGKIKILKAEWGTKNISKDMTEKVRKEVEENGRRDIPATNEFLGGDPDFGKQKTLSVQYRKFGWSRTKSVKEYGRLIL